VTPDRSTDTRASQSVNARADRGVDTYASRRVDIGDDASQNVDTDVDRSVKAGVEQSANRNVAERLAAWIVPERNPGGAVYGLITLGALLAAESGLRDTYPETIGSAALAVVLYWFAHSYSDVLGLRLDEHESFSWAELWLTFSRDWAIAKGACVPLLVLLAAWALGTSQITGVTAAVWSIVASLIAFELAAGIRSKARPLELALEVLVGASMGIGILALRALLH
jgi:hypothetical protein